jgi:hypothetical protein
MSNTRARLERTSCVVAAGVMSECAYARSLLLRTAQESRLGLD